MRCLVASSMLLAISTTAIAQPAPPPIALAPLADPGRPPAPRRAKSPSIAAGLALGVTCAGGAMLLTSSSTDGTGGEVLGVAGLGVLLIGPSVGHFYVGRYARGTGSVLLRVGGVGLMAASLQNLACDSGCNQSGGAALAAAGGIIVVASTIYDLIDAPRAARHANAGMRVMITPAPLPTSTGAASGLVIAGTF